MFSLSFFFNFINMNYSPRISHSVRLIVPADSAQLCSLLLSQNWLNLVDAFGWKLLLLLAAANGLCDWAAAAELLVCW